MTSRGRRGGDIRSRSATNQLVVAMTYDSSGAQLILLQAPTMATRTKCLPASSTRQKRCTSAGLMSPLTRILACEYRQNAPLESHAPFPHAGDSRPMVRLRLVRATFGKAYASLPAECPSNRCILSTYHQSSRSGQEFIAAIRTKLARNVRDPLARRIVMMRSSNGWRSVSRFLEPNPGNSSSDECQKSSAPRI